MSRPAICCALILLGAIGTGVVSALELPPGVPIVLGADEPAPVRRAVEDLQRDLARVLGRPSPVLATLPDGPALVVACGDSPYADLADPRIQGREAHGISVSGKRVILQGTDTRGAIYAVYEFSERFLDIPALWFWASWEAAPKAAIRVPATTRLSFPPAAVPWRAWFPNDQDLLRKWRDGESRYAPVLEAMLRLKLNVIDVGNIRDWPRPATGLRLARSAKACGLAVTTTHTSPFGASFRNWESFWQKVKGVPPPVLSPDSSAALDTFWQYHIDLIRREKLEMLWAIGFRGSGDRGFFETMQNAPTTDAERARIIRAMLERQIALLKRSLGAEPAPMKVVMYNESSRYFAEGLFRPPSDPNLIWVFCSARRDHFPAADIRGYSPPADRAIGYYMNFQFTSTGSHLAAAEGPWKMARNFRDVAQAGPGPLVYSVVNSGNTREHVLELAANAAMMWQLEGFDPDRWLNQFCTQYFGTEHAADVAALYRAFYDSYWQQKASDLPDFPRQYLMQDQRIARAGDVLLKELKKSHPRLDPFDDKNMGYFRIEPADNACANEIQAVAKGTGTSITALESLTRRAEALADKLPRGRQFFRDNLLVQARFLLQANTWLNALARAAQPTADRLACLAEALAAAHAMKTELAVAEHGEFAGWFIGDRLFNVAGRIKRTADALSSLHR